MAARWRVLFRCLAAPGIVVAVWERVLERVLALAEWEVKPAAPTEESWNVALKTGGTLRFPERIVLLFCSALVAVALGA